MKLNQDEYNLLDLYHKGTLSGKEADQLRDRMNRDAEFKMEAESYLELIGTLKFYGDRKKIKDTFDLIHESMNREQPNHKIAPVPAASIKKYWRITSVAASIMIFSVVGTLLITQSHEKKATADYKELRRNVKQIEKSQKQMIADLAESKSITPPPGKYSGSSFLISPNGYVASSYHVIKESDSIAIENDAYGRFKASVVYSDVHNDITILKIEQPNFKVKGSLPFTISQKEADLGEYVYTLGFPKDDIVFGEGSVSASTGFGQNPNAYQISIPVNPGNSGGPLINANGDLIGMVSGVQTETAGAAFATKSLKLLDLLKEQPFDSLTSPLILPKQNTMRSASRVQQIKKWREFVFMVRVYKGK